MALSNGNSEWGDKKFINLKLTSEPGPTKEQPKFVVLWDDFKETEERYSELKGKLTKLVWTHTPPKGKRGDVYGFKAFFEDTTEGANEIYVIESTLTNASKDLLNALLANMWVELKINLYLNKNEYPTSSVKLADGNWAQTSMEFNKIDTKELYEQLEGLNKEKEWEEITVENMPF